MKTNWSPNNLCRCSSLKGLGHNSPLLKCGLHIVTSFPRLPYGKQAIGEGKGRITVEKSDKHCLSQVIKVDIAGDKSCSLDVIWWEWYIHFCGLPPQIPQPQSTHEENIKQISAERQLQNTWPELPKTSSQQNKESLEAMKRYKLSGIRWIRSEV